jgi:hypothetical protein
MKPVREILLGMVEAVSDAKRRAWRADSSPSASRDP